MNSSYYKFEKTFFFIWYVLNTILNW